MAHNSQISALRKKRASVKSSCTRMKTYVDSITQLTPELIANLEERKERLSQFWSDYNNMQSELESLCEDEGHDRIQFEDTFFELSSAMRRMISSTNSSSGTILTPSVSPVAENNGQCCIRLPKLNLPNFSGKYEDWFPFHDMFNSIVNNNQTLNDLQRFQYLKASVTGDAAAVIQSLELSIQNYQVAWNLLKQRYDNKRTVVHMHLRALFELPILTKENAGELRRIADGAMKHMLALHALQRPIDSWDDIIIYLLISKLDMITAREWQASLKGTELPTFKQFIDFLNHRCQLLEATAKNNNISIASNVRPQPNIKRVASHFAAVNSPCSYCKGDHLIYYCREFLKLPISERLVEVRKRKLCTNCLRSAKHSRSKCKFGTCKTCGNKHNSLLHLSSDTREISKEPRSVTVSSQVPSEDVTVATHSATSYNQYVLLSTAVVYVVDSSGNKQTCRVLLDSGSQANFITRSCAERLKLNSQPSNTIIAGINGVTSHASHMVRLELQSRSNKFSSIIQCFLTDRITEQLPTIPINRAQIQVPHNIKLADPEFHRCSDIDVLIGADLFWRLLCVGQIRACRSHPTLQKTQFGWIVSGRLNNNPDRNKGSEFNNFHVSLSSTTLQEQLARFWQLEEFSRDCNSYSASEQFCEQHFADNVSRNSQGQIIVKLPIKEDKLRLLGDTRAIALRRFYNLERRLERDSNLKSQYTQFMLEYLALGHMKLINTNSHTSTVEIDINHPPSYYLPHHCVLKPSSNSTRLRVVFDGSCKSTTGISLNDVLLVGPTIQQDLFSIVLRFRMFKFAFTADITKMYRQVLIDPTQTRLQRIFWRDSASLDVQTYELTTVTYGTAAAPYLATKSLKYLAELYAKDYPVGAQRIVRDFYVDDMLTGADTMAAAIEARDEIVKILGFGSFVLNKWSSNEPRLLDNVQDKISNEIKIGKETTSRILGVLWNPSADAFRFSLELESSLHKVTKRVILSEISRLFDPLGLIGPVVIIAKLLMQEIWQLNIQWDESIPLDIHTKWLTFKYQLSLLNKLDVPRCVKVYNNYMTFQLHGFCDASQRAYGACIYIRSQISKEEFYVQLLCSKTRVAPLKTISLPRLELCAALLLAQLFDKVRSSIDLTDIQSIFWSDSTITLHWISSCSRKWSVFVANRVGEIQRLTNCLNWRHVSSSDNPADLLSRGMEPSDLLNASLWWHGPEFLRNDNSLWPNTRLIGSDCNMPELKKVVLISTSATNPIVDLVARFSNLNKICRIVAYCLRFCRTHFRAHNNSQAVTHEEISIALNILCRLVQREVFSGEIKLLKTGASLNSSSCLKSLSPFLDDIGLLRVGGRLKNSDLPYDACHPILLPKSHRLTQLIIEKEHIRNLHAGLQGTIAAVRQNFWPLSVRSTTRGIIRRCITCFKCKPNISEARMGVLPSPRVTPSRPFSCCGVDYAGPVILREGKRRNSRNRKAYICIFVCFAIKAVHIELVSDLTSEAFLAAFRRFISRRGKPVSVYSDNGTTFVGAARQLTEFYNFLNTDQMQERIKQVSCDLKISWHFIPPNAPHFGGLWESVVKSAKFHLHRVVGNAHLTFEELQTILCEVEALLNSRPLTAMSSDPNDLNYLTPGHFLVGDVLGGFPCRDLSDIHQNRLLRWQRVEQLRQHFWSRWSREYLHQLQQRHKWPYNKGEQLKSGQLVLIRQPGLPPLQWMLGRVERLHSGADGIARSARITTTRGSIVRPLSRLSILPLET